MVPVAQGLEAAAWRAGTIGVVGHDRSEERRPGMLTLRSSTRRVTAQMARCLLSMVLGVHAGLGLLLPLPPDEASGSTKPLAQPPVIGRLADGGTFHGRLRVQTMTVDETGRLVVTDILSGTATPASGRAPKIPARTVTLPTALLDLGGTRTMLVLALAPLTVAPHGPQLTPVPVLLAPAAAPQEERLVQRALCTVAHLQK